MRALIEALNLLDRFEILAAHLAAIMVFKLTALLLSLADNVSLYGDNDVNK